MGRSADGCDDDDPEYRAGDFAGIQFSGGAVGPDAERGAVHQQRVFFDRNDRAAVSGTDDHADFRGGSRFGLAGGVLFDASAGRFERGHRRGQREEQPVAGPVFRCGQRVLFVGDDRVRRPAADELYADPGDDLVDPRRARQLCPVTIISSGTTRRRGIICMPACRITRLYVSIRFRVAGVTDFLGG